MGQSLDHIWYCRTGIAKQFVALTLRGTVKGDDQMIWSRRTNSFLVLKLTNSSLVLKLFPQVVQSFQTFQRICNSHLLLGSTGMLSPLVSGSSELGIIFLFFMCTAGHFCNPQESPISSNISMTVLVIKVAFD